jgi:ribonuclease P protein component
MDRLKKRAQFVAVAKGLRAGRRAFTLQAAPVEPSAAGVEPVVAASAAPRIGFTVTRKVGTAVERNRMRRRLKAAIQLLGDKVGNPGCDYVLLARREALHHPFATLLDDLDGAFRHVHKAMRSRKAGTTQRATTGAGPQSTQDPRQDR